mmetsp:Transcript_23272/g.54367  ORF Transcript_23272/g.54367 Transcript_23272/m.54367 type:complete len:316 (+) Transcript_23272:551-1498(+)
MLPVAVATPMTGGSMTNHLLISKRLVPERGAAGGDGAGKRLVGEVTAASEVCAAEQDFCGDSSPPARGLWTIRCAIRSRRRERTPLFFHFILRGVLEGESTPEKSESESVSVLVGSSDHSGVAGWSALVGGVGAESEQGVKAGTASVPASCARCFRSASSARARARAARPDRIWINSARVGMCLRPLLKPDLFLSSLYTLMNWNVPCSVSSCLSGITTGMWTGYGGHRSLTANIASPVASLSLICPLWITANPKSSCCAANGMAAVQLLTLMDATTTSVKAVTRQNVFVHRPAAANISTAPLQQLCFSNCSISNR